MKGVTKMNTDKNIKNIDGLVVETSFVYDFVSRGETKPIGSINPEQAGNLVKGHDVVLLFTQGKHILLDNSILIRKVAIVADKNMVVTEIINLAVQEPMDFIVPRDCFVLLACDSGSETAEIGTFFAEKFKSGDSIKLKIHNKQVTIPEILTLAGQTDELPASLVLSTKEIFTTVDSKIKIEGNIQHTHKEENYSIIIKQYDPHGQLIEEVHGKLEEDYRFSEDISVNDGVNYIDVELLDSNNTQTSIRSVIVFKKINPLKRSEKHVVMWVEQFVNGKSLNSIDKIELMINTAKAAGITEFALDLKGCEGFAAYKKTTLSNAPYMTNTKDPKKKKEVEEIHIDFLEEFIQIAHSKGMKVYGSINFFVEGNNATKDYAIDVPNTHPEWAEVLQAPEDGGELKSVLETKRNAMLLYVNPANDQVQEYQLKRAEEVLLNYEIDGLIMDRARYDNQYADFSEVSRIKFEAYLNSMGKKLENWPGDAFSINKEGVMTQGQHYIHWIEFRSSVIQQFSNKLKELVDRYRSLTNRDIKLAAYVGSWYEIYYQNGVNWADESFVYNKRLNFPTEELYTREYAKMSYINNLDFIMIGCYYDTKEQIEKYVTLGNILINNKINLIGSISLPDLKTPDELKEGFRTTLDNSDGTMIFDLCYTDWNTLTPAMKEG